MSKNNIQPFEKFSHERRKPEQRDPPEYSIWAELSRTMLGHPEAKQLDAKRTRLNLYFLLSAERGSIIHTVLVLQVLQDAKMKGSLRSIPSTQKANELCNMRSPVQRF